MQRFAGGWAALLLFLSACATVAYGPRLSQADVRRIADAEVRPKVDLRQYEISGLHYVRRGGYWSVSYRRKTETREGFTVRVADKIEQASIDESDAGIFEGELNEKPDNH
jgi:hypothetical protein